MPIIEHSQFIHAPIEVCFNLARNVNIHMQTTSKTKERAVSGVTEGFLEKGDFVTWEAIHLGIKQRLTAEVTVMEKPNLFVDVMVKGIFHSFVHTHRFVQRDNGTVMIDVFQYKAPFGVLGILADHLFLKRYMKEFIVTRAIALKKIAEEKT